MIAETSTIKTEAIFSEDRQRRYLLRKEWDSKLEQATIIMTNPSTADILTMDYTTLYIMNNLVKLNFGAFEAVNLTSSPTVKLKVKGNVTENLEEENVSHIIKSCEKSSHIIIAWGRLGDNSKIVKALQDKLLEHLKPFADKLHQFCDDNGEFGFHPLAPSIRFAWHLIKFELPKERGESERPKQTKTAKNKKSQESNPAVEAINTAESEPTEEQSTA
jgi:hypothetical protein